MIKNRILYIKKKLVHVVEIIEKFIMIGSKENYPILHINQYPELDILEKNYEIILNEYLMYINNDNEIPYMDNLSNAQKRIVDKHKWQAVFLRIYGKNIPQSKLHFKITHELISKINGITTVFFSVFQPETHLKPHRGPYKGILRYHLGLIIPRDTEKCALLIDNIKLNWQLGCSILFDDTYMHEAWNNSDETRVVLFVDIKRRLKFPFNYINDFFLFLIRYSPFVNEIFSNAKK